MQGVYLLHCVICLITVTATLHVTAHTNRLDCRPLGLLGNLQKGPDLLPYLEALCQNTMFLTQYVVFVCLEMSICDPSSLT